MPGEPNNDQRRLIAHDVNGFTYIGQQMPDKEHAPRITQYVVTPTADLAAKLPIIAGQGFKGRARICYDNSERSEGPLTLPKGHPNTTSAQYTLSIKQNNIKIYILLLF